MKNLEALLEDVKSRNLSGLTIEIDPNDTIAKIISREIIEYHDQVIECIRTYFEESNSEIVKAHTPGEILLRRIEEQLSDQYNLDYDWEDLIDRANFITFVKPFEPNTRFWLMVIPHEVMYFEISLTIENKKNKTITVRELQLDDLPFENTPSPPERLQSLSELDFPLSPSEIDIIVEAYGHLPHISHYENIIDLNIREVLRKLIIYITTLDSENADDMILIKSTQNLIDRIKSVL